MLVEAAKVMCIYLVVEFFAWLRRLVARLVGATKVNYVSNSNVKL